MRADNWLEASRAVPIRHMTVQGIDKFRTYLSTVKVLATEPFPSDLLFDEAQARILDRHVTVEPGQFRTTLEMMRYLHPRIEALRLASKYFDPGLWAWLTAFYFDDVCPPDKSGRRKVGEIARYIPPMQRDFRDDNRHLLAAPMRMFDTHGEARMRLFLYTPPHEKSEFLRLIMELQELSANPNLLDALQMLYSVNHGS